MTSTRSSSGPEATHRKSRSPAMRASALMALAIMILAAAAELWAEEERSMEETVLLHENFEDGMDNWWVEGSEDVWVEDGRLHVNADPPRGSGRPHVATIWCHTPISGDVRISFDAHIISSSTHVNNINTWLFFSDPEGTPLYETRHERARGSLDRTMQGNVVTFLADDRTREDAEVPGNEHLARIRIRHCPDYQLRGETYAYHCRAGHTYRIEIIRRGSFIELHVDGNYLLGVETAVAWEEGLLGLRTYQTYLWWDNVRVTALD